MDFTVKHYNELTIDELFDIFLLRETVFVGEQKCDYDIDMYDKVAYHVYAKDENGMFAYARVLPPDTVYPEASIGRVVSTRRRCGIGTKTVEKSIEVAKEKFGAKKITIGAQLYVKSLYDKIGFETMSDGEFMEVGIPHVHMQWRDKQ